MSVAAVIAVAIGALLNADPKRIVQGISRMRMAILPLIALTLRGGLFNSTWDCSADALRSTRIVDLLNCRRGILDGGCRSGKRPHYVGYSLSPAGGDIDAGYLKPFDRFSSHLGRRNYGLAPYGMSVKTSEPSMPTINNWGNWTLNLAVT